MSNALAVTVAGGKVLAEQSFGTSQGYWFSLVHTPSGAFGFAHALVGSCSHCDHFKAQVGSLDHYHEGKRQAVDIEVVVAHHETCTGCGRVYERIRLVGEGLMATMMTLPEVRHEAKRTDATSQIIAFAETAWMQRRELARDESGGGSEG